jgi:hypothetical protein
VDTNRNHKYGYAHKQLRRRLAIEIARGSVNCARCGRPILPTMKWDLGHLDGGGPNDYNGPEHRRCSRGTAGNGLANTQGFTPPKLEWPRTSRDW